MALGTINDYFPSVPGCKGKRKLEDGDKTGDSISEGDIRQRRYDTVFLGDLKPGPKRVTFMARIVNIFEQSNAKPSGSSSKRSRPAANGGANRCLKILAKDDSGSIMIKLWYTGVHYGLTLGSLISIWTMHISAFKKAENNAMTQMRLSVTGAIAGSIAGASVGVAACAGHTPAIMTSISPEREKGSQIMIHQRSDIGIACRMPLGYREGQTFSSLDLLSETYRKTVSGEGSKVLVFVKGVGKVKQYTNLQSQNVERVEVGIADETGEAILVLYDVMMRSALAWTPNSTVLLISNASWKEAGCRVFVNAMTFIEVDPDIVEADWLRKHALNTAVYVNQPFPEGDFDVEAFEGAVDRIKLTLADIDEFARASSNEVFMGYVCLVLMEVNLVALYKRKQLFCNECCYMPIFANSPTATCRQCDADIELRINPQIVGSVVDETGMISCSRSQQPSNKPAHKGGSSPLLWSAEAIHQLLGCRPLDLVAVGGRERGRQETLELLDAIQPRLAFSRIIALFGWYPRNGKVAICKVLRGDF